MKDEGGRMKDEGGRMREEGSAELLTMLILSPYLSSLFIPPPSSFLPHPSSLIPIFHPSSFRPPSNRDDHIVADDLAAFYLMHGVLSNDNCSFDSRLGGDSYSSPNHRLPH